MGKPITLTAFLQPGDVIHITSSTADDPQVCYPAILGGKTGDHWWVIEMTFAASRIAWLNDERWHPKDGCTTNSGKLQEIKYPNPTL